MSEAPIASTSDVRMEDVQQPENLEDDPEEEEEEDDELEEQGDSDNDPEDPVVAEYDVFITPESEHKLYVLQFIGRRDFELFSEHHRPIELRIKPETGYVEVDIPMDIHQYYDRAKGVYYGEAQRRTKGFGQSTYGASAGYLHAMPRSTKRPGAPETEADPDEALPPSHMVDEVTMDQYVNNFEDANEKGHVLNKVTWSGRIYPREPEKPQNDCKPKYMIGTFRGKELHLTKLDGIIQMRPELHHVDAVSHLEVASRRREVTDARAVLPTIKKNADEEGSIASQLKKAVEEPWEKMRWIHSEHGEAYEAFNRRLFLEDTEKAPIIEWESVTDYVERVLPKKVGVKVKTETIGLDD